jgi:hypothetical protein
MNPPPARATVAPHRPPPPNGDGLDPRSALQRQVYRPLQGRVAVPFVLLWSNLGGVALPFLAALTLSAVFAIPLRRAAEGSGLPRARERCLGCAAERALLRRGYCTERCVVNGGPAVPLVLFVATSTFVLFALFAPAAFARAVLPFALGGPGVAQVLAGLLVGTNAAAAVLLAAFFFQDRAATRRLFVEGAVVVALLGLLLAGLAPLLRVPGATLLTPLALLAVLLFAAIERRARVGRPAFGWRSVGLAAVPLFLVALCATVRLLEFVRMATG